MRRAALLTLAVLALLPGAAAAKSNDSLAPNDAPAHWLPPEAWVYNHWLPYDEGRLYALLGITRAQLWQQLRDDHRTLAQLAARHGWRDPRAARATRSSRRGAAHVGAAPRSRCCAARACARSRRATSRSTCSSTRCTSSRSPSRAPQIFGVERRGASASCGARRAQPAGDRPPARPLAGAGARRWRSRCCASAPRAASRGQRDHRARRRGSCCAASSASFRAGWTRRATTARRRRTAARSSPLPHDYATNPAISADGTHVAYEAYRQKLPLAIKLGEIAVAARDSQRARHARQPPGGAAGRPAAGPALGLQPADLGRRALRRVRVLARQPELRQALRAHRGALADPRAGARRGVDHPPRGEDHSQSAYNPALAADGRRVAFQAVRDGRDGAGLRLRPAHRRADAGQRRLPRAPRGTVTSIYEPRLSADGRFVAFTAVTSRASGGPGATASSVVLRDLGPTPPRP